jgi:hypothetical protein
MLFLAKYFYDDPITRDQLEGPFSRSSMHRKHIKIMTSRKENRDIRVGVETIYGQEGLRFNSRQYKILLFSTASKIFLRPPHCYPTLFPQR